MRFHWQNLKKEEKSTRYIANGRFWLGRNPQLHVEWVVPSRSINFQLDINDYGDTAVGGSIGILFFTAYWGIEWIWLYNLLEKLTRRKDQKYTNGRNIGFNIDSHSLNIYLWNDPMESRAADPRWWNFHMNFSDFFLGKSKCSTEILEEREVLIPMPEKAYEGTAKLTLSTWTRPRWFAKQMKRVEIDCPEGLPHEGKGENSWDCGINRTTSMTTGECNSIPKGVGLLVGSVLDDRIRYGGWRDWKWDKKLGETID